jgi:hypothetical protein
MAVSEFLYTRRPRRIQKERAAVPPAYFVAETVETFFYTTISREPITFPYSSSVS